MPLTLSCASCGLLPEQLLSGGCHGNQSGGDCGPPEESSAVGQSHPPLLLLLGQITLSRDGTTQRLAKCEVTLRSARDALWHPESVAVCENVL